MGFAVKFGIGATVGSCVGFGVTLREGACVGCRVGNNKLKLVDAEHVGPRTTFAVAVTRNEISASLQTFSENLSCT